MSWIEFWDAAPGIYVSRLHKLVHYRGIAQDIMRHIPHVRARVLDYGCGEALCAAEVAAQCEHIYLCDAAPSVRADLMRRLAQVPNVSVLAPSELDRVLPGTVDLVVVNSVVQYLTSDDLATLIGTCKALLAPDGKVVFADIIPPNVGIAADALALLRLAAANGFLTAAILGLIRTFFSSYRGLRTRLGIATFGESEFIALLGSYGLAASRVYPNFGHNQSRMTFVAQVDDHEPAFEGRAGTEALLSA